nr:hypothetical protein [Petrachloros mirabilis]
MKLSLLTGAKYSDGYKSAVAAGDAPSIRYDMKDAIAANLSLLV